MRMDAALDATHNYQKQSSTNYLYITQFLKRSKRSIPRSLEQCTHVQYQVHRTCSCQSRTLTGCGRPTSTTHLQSRDKVCLHNHLVRYPHRGWDHRRRVSADLVHYFPIQPTKKKTRHENARTTKGDNVQKTPGAGSNSPRSSTRVSPGHTVQSTECRASRATMPGGPASVRRGPARIRGAASRTGPAAGSGLAECAHIEPVPRGEPAGVVKGVPDLDAMPRPDADAVAFAGPPLMLVPAWPRKMTGKTQRRPRRGPLAPHMGTHV